jgi:Tol biopolymer transport system component/DNA-binding winged helix-turn-helix (wHTH) protein
LVRFASFEVDLREGELRKNGLKLKLTGQPFQILAILLERPGEAVSREELQKRLWPDSFVDADGGLNTAINKVREALGDSAENPRFISTLPRRGYRFIAPVQRSGEAAGAASNAVPAPSRPLGSFRRFRLASIAVLVVAALAVAFIYFWPPRHAPAEALMPAPFTAFAGAEVNPAFSPDGSQIAFAWNGDPASGSKGFDLYVKRIGSENLLRLTNHPSEVMSPAWSPDGAQIAFHRILGKETGLYAVPAQGGPERKLRETRMTPRAPQISWSPDGQWIAFADSLVPGGHWRLYLLWLDTLRTTQIPHSPECMDELYPAFSHDGKRLAYLCVSEQGGFSVYALAPPSGAPELIRHLDGWPFGLAWTRADQGLVIAPGHAGNDDDHLYVMAVADGSLQKLPFPGSLTQPAVSAAGDKLAYEASRAEEGDISIWRKDLLHPDAAAVNLISSTRWDLAPQFSPDGKHIAFASSRRGNLEIWMSNADGTNPIQISHFGNPTTGSPFWSPDSKKIVFDSGRFGAANLYITDIAERVPRKLITNVRYASVPSWSRDGKWIYFVGDGNENGGIIYRCPANGGDAVALSAERGYGPRESFDGKYLYFASNGEGNTVLKLISLEGRTESVPDGVPPLRFLTDWTIVPGGVYYIPADGPPSIQYFDFRSKRGRQVLESDRPFSMGISVSRDARWLLYARVDQFDRDIMLVEHFQ